MKCSNKNKKLKRIEKEEMVFERAGWKDKVNREKCHEGYSDVSYEDVWNMDNTLAQIISKYLHAFLKAEKGPNGGCPGEFESLYGEEKAFNMWLQIIRKMIYAFEEYPLHKSDTEQDPERVERIKEGVQLFIDYFRYLWI